MTTSYDVDTKSIHLPWRTDYPKSVAHIVHRWQSSDLDPRTNWDGFMSAGLTEIRSSGLGVEDGRIYMPPTAPWWIVPWMDYTKCGREPINGLTSERHPGAGDLSPRSRSGYETWAIGWYNAEGASALGKVFLDHCDPRLPVLSTRST